MMLPIPPPAWICSISSRTSLVPFASPPEKMTMRFPLKALCTTWRMRSESFSIGIDS